MLPHSIKIARFLKSEKFFIILWVKWKVEILEDHMIIINLINPYKISMCIKGKCAVHEPENICVLINSSVAYFSGGGSGPAAATPETSPGKHHFSSIWFNYIVSYISISFYAWTWKCFTCTCSITIELFGNPSFYVTMHVFPPILHEIPFSFVHLLLLFIPWYIWQLAGTRVLPGEPHNAAAVKARSYIATEIIKSFSCF